MQPRVYAALASYNEALDDAAERLETLSKVPYFRSHVTDVALNMIKLARAMVAHDLTLALAEREAKNAGYYDRLAIKHTKRHNVK